MNDTALRWQPWWNFKDYLLHVGQAGAGLGEVSPSAAEDSQIPDVIQQSKEKVEGSNPTPTKGGLFGFFAPKVNEQASIAEGPADVLDNASQAASKVQEAVTPSSTPRGQVDKVPDANSPAERADNGVGSDVLGGAGQVADKAAEAVEKPAEAVEKAVESVPAPDILPKESVEKPGEALKGSDANRAATPTGMEVSRLYWLLHKNHFCMNPIDCKALSHPWDRLNLNDVAKGHGDADKSFLCLCIATTKKDVFIESAVLLLTVE